MKRLTCFISIFICVLLAGTPLVFARGEFELPEGERYTSATGNPSHSVKPRDSNRRGEDIPPPPRGEFMTEEQWRLEQQRQRIEAEQARRDAYRRYKAAANRKAERARATQESGKKKQAKKRATKRKSKAQIHEDAVREKLGHSYRPQ